MGGWVGEVYTVYMAARGTMVSAVDSEREKTYQPCRRSLEEEMKTMGSGASSGALFKANARERTPICERCSA